MAIIYSLVSRRDVILAHYSTTTGNFVNIASMLLKKLPVADSQTTYEYDGHLFHSLVNDGITFLCITDSEIDRRIALAFLFDTKSRFSSKFPEDLYMRATSFSLNDEFARVLANQMDYYSHNPSSDKINQIKNQLDKTKQQVFNNVEKLQNRVVKLDFLVEETETAHSNAMKFKSQSDKVKWAIVKKNLKYFAFLIVLGVIIFWLFLSLFCGLSLKNC